MDMWLVWEYLRWVGVPTVAVVGERCKLSLYLWRCELANEQNDDVWWFVRADACVRKFERQ